MNEKVPVHNNTAMPIYVGSHMVPPGETRLFDEDQVPMHLRPVKAEPAAEVEQVDPVEALAAKPVKDVIAALDSLTNEQLEQLTALENAREKPRSTLLTAIGELSLSRADVEALSEKSDTEIIAAIPQLTDQQLEKLGDLEQLRQEPRSTVLEAVSEAILQRGSGQ